jgi:hypothetical protein
MPGYITSSSSPPKWPEPMTSTFILNENLKQWIMEEAHISMPENSPNGQSASYGLCKNGIKPTMHDGNQRHFLYGGGGHLKRISLTRIIALIPNNLGYFDRPKV